MKATMIGLSMLMLGAFAQGADANTDRYSYRHCNSCVRRTGYRWVQRETITQKRVVAGYRKEFAGYRKEFAGYQKVVSHYKWVWKTEWVYRHPPVRIHRKVQVPVYKTIATYRNVATYRSVPMYKWKNVSVIKWVQVPYTYFDCRR